VSSDKGASWQKETLTGISAPVSISVAGKVVAVAGVNMVVVSVNGGESWLPSKPLGPEFAVNSVSVDNRGDIWMGTRTGLFRSTDAGDSWKQITTLRLSNILSVQFDDENHRVLATSGNSTNVLESRDNGKTWSAIGTGWHLRNLSLANGRLLGTTIFDGVVIQPGVTGVEAAGATGTR
jgi:photosystem II stability/assembly factor-like uncharacterized protein